MNDRNPPSAGRALSRLVIVLAAALFVVLFAIGWNVTEISLDPVRDPTRQAAVQRAMRQLLSPDIFTRDREQRDYTTQFAIGCPEGETPDDHFDLEGDAYITIDPPCADPDDTITVRGYHFPEDAIARIQLVRESGQTLPFRLIGPTGVVVEQSTFDTNSVGEFTVTLKVPRARGLAGSVQQLSVQTVEPSGLPRLSDTTHNVIDRMIETIFLAFMATVLALPPSVAVSFTAAHNLMRPITLPLGSTLVGFVMLPIGGLLGYFTFGALGAWAVGAAEKPLAGLIVLAVAVALFVAGSLAVGRLGESTLSRRLRSLFGGVLLLAILVVVTGVLGGWGLWLGRRLQEGLLNDLGNFVGTLGELIDLTVQVVAAVAGALWLASIGSNIAAPLLRHVGPPLGNALGALLGALSGAILMGAMGLIGMQAVLLGLLPPIVAAFLGGAALVLLYLNLIPKRRAKLRTGSEQAVDSTLFAVGAVIAFLITAYQLNVIRAVVDQRLPNMPDWNLGLLTLNSYAGQAAIIGAVLGGLSGALSGVTRPFPLGMTIYNTSRTILNVLRSIEPLIMGIVFVIWVSVGPFAGVLALTLHSIASLGKLFSEQVENIDAGPMEAIQATGANRLQTIVYAVVPQIVPPYIAFTMYRWDINVRMSTIIGFVGGGGIGFLLQQQINLLRYNQAGVAVLAIAIVVSALDYASAAIRARIL